MPRTVVVTGAGSGMGRAAALLLARRGDRLVLASRGAAPLDSLARECEALGARALAVPTDVTDVDAVEDLARSAVGGFGGFDAWVNTAAVQSFGKFWDVPPRAAQRVVEVVLVGAMNVSRVALDHFRGRGRGTLVLVSSILAKTPSPYLNVYNAAKHGVAGLATSLRMDLALEGLGRSVRVVELRPPSTDTPFFVHAANYTGKVAKPPPPAYEVATLARAVVRAVDRPRDRVTVGAAAKAMRVLYALAPRPYELVASRMTRGMFADEREPPNDGNLFEPMPGTARRRGGWKEDAPLTKQGTRR